MCSTNAYEEARKIFLSLEPPAVALAGGARFDPANKLLRLAYCGKEYEIRCSDGQVELAGSREEVPYNDKTLIMQYLAQSSGLPPRGHWLSFLELPEGIHHYAPFQTDALIPLAEKFGLDEAGFLQAGASLKGEQIKMGDVAVVIPALPRVPLAVMLWLGDEEFPAKGNVLFDSVAPTHLSTASLWVLGVEVTRKLIKAEV